MKINRLPAIAFASALAMGCQNDPPQIKKDPDVVCMDGNRTANEKRSAAYLEQKYGGEYRCFDNKRYLFLGQMLTEGVDGTRRKIHAATKCETVPKSHDECPTTDVLLDEKGNPITDVSC